MLLGCSDFWVFIYVGCWYFGMLLCVGVCIYECYDWLLYVKMVVIDGVWVMVGFSNFDWCSIVYNVEVNVVVLDSGFV